MNVNHLKKIDNIMKEMVDSGFAAGASTLILQDGKEIYYNAEGFIDIEKQKKVERDSIFRLYSMSKPITGAAVMLLCEDGLLDLNLPVGEFLPTYKKQVFLCDGEKKPVWRDMKVKDLLNMTSGLSYGGISNENETFTTALTLELMRRMDTDHEMTTLEFASSLGDGPLLFSPGTDFNYSFSADVLGAIIEVVTGKRFGDFMKERIFEPLEMQDTDFWVPAEKQERLTKVYEQSSKGLKEYTFNNLGVNLAMAHRPGFESGGAGLVSTLDDYNKFAQMLMNKGLYNGKRIMQEGTVKYFTCGKSEASADRAIQYMDGMNGFTYANLLRVCETPERSVTLCSKGEYGWDGWLGPYFINDPAHKITILHMLQRKDSGTTSYMRRIRNVVYSACES